MLDHFDFRIRGVSLDVAVVDLGPFRLEQDLAAGLAGVGPLADDHAVDDVGDLAAVADALDGVPLAGRLLGVLLLDDPPSRDLAAVDDDRGAVDEPEVAAIVLLDLALDRLGPDLVGADAVEQDARVAHGVLAGGPLLLAPLEFELEAVVAVFLHGQEAAEFLARDVDEAVLDPEDPLGVGLRVGAVRVGDERVPAREVLAVEQRDGFAQGRGVVDAGRGRGGQRGRQGQGGPERASRDEHGRGPPRDRGPAGIRLVERAS